jgi:hypothetical protein
MMYSLMSSIGYSQLLQVWQCSWSCSCERSARYDRSAVPRAPRACGDQTAQAAVTSDKIQTMSSTLYNHNYDEVVTVYAHKR